MIKHYLTLTLALTMVLIVTGCQEPHATPPTTYSDMKIGTTFDPQTVFPKTANYDFIRVSPDEEGLSPEAVAIVNRVRKALAAELKAKGYSEKSQTGEVDFFVDYELVAQHNVTILAERAQAAGEEWITVVGMPDDFIEGALVVDVIDYTNLRTVWRGV
ncbi:MAG: DUF4136 domain-containing protein, partial [Planctomycetota bacterium]